MNEPADINAECSYWDDISTKFNLTTGYLTIFKEA